ncbi:GTPase HflX [Salsuginibacillus halophilus]|uniref:GTPase HflX n=1 Tax=Salsuginibacillus halophilus TaxID=517424 RepID=UPI003CFC1650
MTEERVILVGCRQKQSEKKADFESSMNELKSLAESAKGSVAAVKYQERDRVHPSTYIGKGKLREIASEAETVEADLLIFNDELSSGQAANIQNMTGFPVIDRTQLILDIFADRAQTKEGKIQVELAQLNYMLPRLTGQGESLSRLGGGIGTRGPGETKLETDRRHIQKRMDDLKKQLEQVKKRREVHREERKRSRRAQFALVGYTNAGKSTILNALTKADAVSEDELFATLDPLTRRVELPSGYQALMSDTVGFIQDLPTSLIASFRSTLEEVLEADVLIHVVDASGEEVDKHLKTVKSHLTQLSAGHLQVITVLNKVDQMQEETFIPEGRTLRMNAYDKNDQQQLLHEMEEALKDISVYFSIDVTPDRGDAVAKIRQEAVLDTEMFDEERSVFRLKGYLFADHPLWGLIQEFKQEET